MDYVNLQKIIDIKNKIEESIFTKRPLVFTYTKWKEYIPEERKVIFQKMYSKNDRFYAIGYCLKRKDNRTFRIDRMEEIRGFDSPAETIPTSLPSLPVDSISVSEKIEEITKEHENQKEIKKAENRRRVIAVIIFFIVGGGLIFGILLGNYPGMWEKIFAEKNDYYVTPASIVYTEIKGWNRNYKQPELISMDRKYREYTIEKQGSHYIIKGVRGEYPSLNDAIVKINTTVFIKVTGIQDEKLLPIYIDADTNKNGFLSWNEIQSFQMKINREFKYIANDTALSPDEFVKEGGGDCEDWALFTAGLLRFWNYDTYIGSLNFKNDYHAIVLVKINEMPFRFKGYKIISAKLEDESELPKGFYTYIQ